MRKTPDGVVIVALVLVAASVFLGMVVFSIVSEFVIN